MTLVNAARVRKSKPKLGWINPTLYAFAENHSYKALFKDVTGGNNQCCAGSPGQQVCAVLILSYIELYWVIVSLGYLLSESQCRSGLLLSYSAIYNITSITHDHYIDILTYWHTDILIYDIHLYNNIITLHIFLFLSQVCCSQGFEATSGWDPATGWGTVNYGLMEDAFMKIAWAWTWAD